MAYINQKALLLNGITEQEIDLAISKYKINYPDISNMDSMIIPFNENAVKNINYDKVIAFDGSVTEEFLTKNNGLSLRNTKMSFLRVGCIEFDVGIFKRYTSSEIVNPNDYNKLISKLFTENKKVHRALFPSSNMVYNNNENLKGSIIETLEEDFQRVLESVPPTLKTILIYSLRVGIKDTDNNYDFNYDEDLIKMHDIAKGSLSLEDKELKYKDLGYNDKLKLAYFFNIDKVAYESDSSLGVVKNYMSFLENIMLFKEIYEKESKQSEGIVEKNLYLCDGGLSSNFSPKMQIFIENTLKYIAGITKKDFDVVGVVKGGKSGGFIEDYAQELLNTNEKAKNGFFVRLDDKTKKIKNIKKYDGVGEEVGLVFQNGKHFVLRPIYITSKDKKVGLSSIYGYEGNQLLFADKLDNLKYITENMMSIIYKNALLPTIIANDIISISKKSAGFAKLKNKGFGFKLLNEVELNNEVSVIKEEGINTPPKRKGFYK